MTARVKKVINIIFSTKNLENTRNLLKSIHAVNYFNKEIKYSLSIFIFDKTVEQDIQELIENDNLCIQVIIKDSIQSLEQKYSEYFVEANCNLSIDSIQRARIQQQIFILENFEEFKNSIIWQVDDDVLFGKSFYENQKHTVSYSIDVFSEIVELHNNHNDIDAIIAPTSYVPPIPSLLYCKTQLEDFFYGKYLSNDSTISKEYHDYYKNDVEISYPLFLTKEKDKNRVVREILNGKPITRAAFIDHSIKKSVIEKSKLFRGANFIVFNLDIFKIPHIGFSEQDGIPARRSDMLHSKLLLELGYTLVDIEYFSLVHNRSFTNASIENSVEKYYSDMIGALLVQYVYKGENEFSKRFIFHKNHIKEIIEVLIENIDTVKFRKEIEKLTALDNKINLLNEAYLINEFKSFKTSKDQLIIKLCKLAS